MLAQNFKTATDLGISEVEVDALIKVLGMLERGEIGSKHFDMSTVWNEHSCGSVGCICGWAHHISGGEAFKGINSGIIFRVPPEAIDLFAMSAEDQDMIHLRGTPATAAIALRSYLSTGKANWAEALA